MDMKTTKDGRGGAPMPAHCSRRAVALALVGTPLGMALGGAAPALAARAAARLLVVGDSLSAEYGLRRGAGWVALLQQRLERERIEAVLVNASISGDTTSGGRTRLPSLLKQHTPSHVVIELGGNDALRGLPLTLTRDNLSAMTQAARDAGARVTLVGMQMPPNYGRQYAEQFAGLYAEVARAQGAALVPFLLKGVADVAQAETLFQSDRIHPNEQAQATMLDNVWSVLRPQLAA